VARNTHIYPSRCTQLFQEYAGKSFLNEGWRSCPILQLPGEFSWSGQRCAVALFSSEFAGCFLLGRHISQVGAPPAG